MDYKADLHCHSHFSDGELSPKELLYLAKKVGLNGLSITDHDNIEAYTHELFSLAESLKIDLLTGVEISSSLQNETVHILGYGFDSHSSILKKFLEEVRERRYRRNIEILKKLAEKNIFLEEKDLYSDRYPKTAIGRPHIAQLLVEKGYVKDFKTAFNEYLKDGGPCFVIGEKFSPLQIIDLLHKVKAKAILAHPDQISDSTVLRELLQMPFDGIEAYYGIMVLHKEMRWVRLAMKKGWLFTGGSDFHGSSKPFVALGCSWVSKECFDKLKP
jgi:3',5'-nucleoside bisphosphate phosphatase